MNNNKTCVYFTGRPQDLMSFEMESSEAYYEWENGMIRIKEFIRAINETVHDDAKRRPLYLQWREMVKKYGAKWGSNGVPQDIKDALKSVEEGVGVDVTVW